MGEDALQFGDERDGATFALVHRIDAKGLTQRLLGVTGGLALRVHGPAHALVERRDMDLGAERRMRFKERHHCLHRGVRLLSGGHAQADAEPCFGADHIERPVHGVRVEADDRGTRLGPQA